MTPDGCFIMSEDPDGTRHGVFGAAKHGYFEATPNHDAGCFRVTDDAANRKIVQRMLALKGEAETGRPRAARPHHSELSRLRRQRPRRSVRPLGQWRSLDDHAGAHEHRLPARR